MKFGEILNVKTHSGLGCHQCPTKGTVRLLIPCSFILKAKGLFPTFLGFFTWDFFPHG